ncbi:hypothetical protein [Leifsonia sp. 21MFCrub1.1]|uniref:hypothetical protein n=1 Tax=Leifsonia sp. 21MFCrub1.1 TaxID=1798223 RepID=UPI0008927CE2|nr:hypothetical protein [Leifsonia sp. 21MFCrub1.1]SEA57836.1 hypothetical protein SAMN04515680_0801 [Leifsonia sp. 21MFCrub1.1]
MARPTNTELLQRIAALEEENAALRRSAEPAADGDTVPIPRPEPVKRQRSWAWTLLATVLIVIGAILAPVAVIASWAKVQLTDTDSFVATYAPLAHDPGVQAFVTDEAVKAVQDNVDIDQLTSQVIDGITGLGTGPVATKALESLKGPLAQGIVSLLQSTVQRFVASDAFAQVWQQALRTSHDQLIATMQNDPNAAITVGSDGSVGIQLGPIIDRVKQLLVEQGVSFAAQIPSVDRTITVAQNSSIPTLQLFYGLAVAAGAWLPWVAIALLALGVVVARRRALALVWAAVALALAMGITLAAIGIGRIVFVSSVSPSLVPSGLAQTLYSTVTDAMIATAVAVLVLAIAVAIVGWFSGPFAVPRRLRGFFGAGVSWVRASAESHGITTGRAGEWMYAQRTLLRAAVAVIAAAVVLFVRPLTPALVIWTLVLAALVVAVLELLQRPAITAPETTDDETPVVTVS